MSPMQIFFNVAVLVSYFVVAECLELAPTNVLGFATPDHRTHPPTETSRPNALFAPTLFKDKESKTTLINLFPSKEIEYQVLRTSATEVRNISSTAIEFATTVNSSLQFSSETYTVGAWPVDSTKFYSVDYQHETLMYTDAQNVTQTRIVENKLPIL